MSITDIFQAPRRQVIIDYLLTHSNAFQRTQISMMRDLAISQATLVKYIAELQGEGLVVEKPFGTAVVYEILYDTAIARGLVERFKIFDLDNYLAAKSQKGSQPWTGKVYNFGDVVYIHARHTNGFTVGIPVYDKDWKELVQAVALGLNVDAFFSAIANYLKKG